MFVLSSSIILYLRMDAASGTCPPTSIRRPRPPDIINIVMLTPELHDHPPPALDSSIYSHCHIDESHRRGQRSLPPPPRPRMAVTRKQESGRKVPKSVLRAVLGRMQFTLHASRRTPHGASRLVQAMSPWLVQTRRAPSRHSRDARVYGHTTTAMHHLGTPPHTMAPHHRLE